MKRILFFDPDVTGHHLEFNLNILKEAKQEGDCNHIFVFGNKFSDLIKSNFSINLEIEFEDLKIVFIPYWYNKLLESKNLIFRSFLYSFFLIFYKYRYNVNYIVILYFNNLLRSIPLFLWKTKFVGILFGQQKFIKKKNQVSNKWMKFILNKKNLKGLYVLNDHKSIKKLKIKFNSNKFIYIPDPIELINLNSYKQIDKEKNSIILLFIGVITSSKGILEVLNVLNILGVNIKPSLEVRIIGRTSKSFRETFYKEMKIFDKNKNDNFSIVLKDKFVEKKEFIKELVDADYVMQTYTSGHGSSGVLGYSKLYNKSIIGSDLGFIGEELERYEEGYVTSMDTISLQNFFSEFSFNKKKEVKINYEYLDDHSYSKFYRILNESFK